MSILTRSKAEIALLSGKKQCSDFSGICHSKSPGNPRKGSKQWSQRSTDTAITGKDKAVLAEGPKKSGHRGDTAIILMVSFQLPRYRHCHAAARDVTLSDQLSRRMASGMLKHKVDADPSLCQPRLHNKDRSLSASKEQKGSVEEDQPKSRKHSI